MTTDQILDSPCSEVVAAPSADPSKQRSLLPTDPHELEKFHRCRAELNAIMRESMTQISAAMTSHTKEQHNA